MLPAEFLLGGMKRQEKGSPSSAFEEALAALAGDGDGDGEWGGLAGRDGGPPVEEDDQSGTGEDRPIIQMK